MKVLAILASLGVGFVLSMFAIQHAGTDSNWELSVFTASQWLPLILSLLIMYALLAIVAPRYRKVALKCVEILTYTAIGLFVLEQWQLSASFPPISLRQHLVELTKLGLIYGFIYFAIKTIRNFTRTIYH